MAARYSYSPYEVADPLAQYQYQYKQSGSSRFFSAVGRFFYRLIVLALIIGAVGGVLFGLYRNDILLTIARGAGVEAKYKYYEQRLGVPGWGTPRSIDLPRETPVAPATPSPVTADETKDAPSKQAETVNAAATSEPKTSTPEGLPILSFDSLPKAKAAPEPVSLDALPAAEPKASRAEPARVARAEPAPVREPRKKAAKAEPAKPVELTRSIPLPKAPPKPEPVAKVEPKPEPPAPKPEPEVDPTKPKASDNPLKAAIRAAMSKQPKSKE